VRIVTNGTLGIHRKPGSFSDRWIEYCLQNKIPYKIIDCYASDVIVQCADVQAVLWHWYHTSSIDKKFARSIIASLEKMGIIVFPSIATCWHYDDKVAQKYLLEAIGAPVIPTFVFYNIADAKQWAKNAEYPLVFKLRAGAGSSNVHLIRNWSVARKHIVLSFSKGWSAIPSIFNDLENRMRIKKMHRELARALWRFPRALYGRISYRLQEREIGYCYFQDFLPNNSFDTRVVVIGNRAFAARRHNRPRDFRASGGGMTDWDPEKIDLKCIEVGYDITQRIGAQSLAFDFLYDAGRNPRIGEISYCFPADPAHNCPGFWDPDLKWHPGHIWPQDAIIEDVLLALEQKRV